MDKRRIRVFGSVGGKGAPAFWESWLDEMQRAGFAVEEVCAVSAQEYRSSAGVFSRIRLRLKMYVGMAFQLARFGLLSPRDSILITTTNPFYAPWFLVSFPAKHHKVINLIYDLYPDSLIAAGKIKAQSVLDHYLAKLTRTAIKKSSATVLLGDRIERYVTQRYGSPAVSRVIPVGTDCSCFPEAPAAELTHPIEILYCGNLGVLHETETLLEGLTHLDEHNRTAFHLQFHASGPCLERFVESVQDRGLVASFSFGGPLSNQEWQNTMSQVSIGLVLLTDSAALSAVPSKVYSAMAAGQAILAICPRESDLADIVVDNNCGWIVDAGDPDALAATLAKIAQDPASIAGKRSNAYDAARDRFCMTVVAEAWKELIDAL